MIYELIYFLEGIMPPFDENNIDMEKLKYLYANDSVAKAVLDYLAARQNNATETKVDRLANCLWQAGHQFSRRDVVVFLKELGQAGCGSFVIGRRGQPSRFEWTVQMISVAKAAKGEQLSVELLDITNEKPLEEEDVQIGMLRHPYRLRPDMTVTLDLPDNLTAKEALRLAEFIKTLPFEETVNI
jgi:hypothetical protein